MHTKKVLAIKEATQFLIQTVGDCSLGSSCLNQKCEKLHRPENGKKICPFIEDEKCVCFNCLGSLENGTHELPIVGRRMVCWHGRSCQHESCVFWHPEPKNDPIRFANDSAGNKSGTTACKTKAVENKVSENFVSINEDICKLLEDLHLVQTDFKHELVFIKTAFYDTRAKIDILEDTITTLVSNNENLISELYKIRAAVKSLVSES